LIDKKYKLKELKVVEVQKEIPSLEGLGLCPPNPPTGGEGGVGFLTKY